jgi:hypothetical protein
MVQQRMNLALALWLNGDEAGAGAAIEAATQASREVGLPQTTLIVDYGRAQLARLGGDLEGAARLLRTTIDGINLVVAAPQFRAMLGSTLGIVLGELGDLEGAEREQNAALAEAIVSPDSPIAGLVLIGHSDLALRRGDPEKAATLLGAAARIAGSVDHSSVDRLRVESAARAALGPDAYDVAYVRGTAYTLKSVREVV